MEKTITVTVHNIDLTLFNEQIYGLLRTIKAMPDTPDKDLLQGLLNMLEVMDDDMRESEAA